MSKFPISPKAMASYPGGTKGLSPKQQGEASKKARMKAIPKGSENLDEELNQGAIEANKNEYGMPLGNQRVKGSGGKAQPKFKSKNANYEATGYAKGTEAITAKADGKRIKLQKKVAKHEHDYEASPSKGVTRKTVFGKKKVSGDEANEVLNAGYIKKSPLRSNPVADRGNVKPSISVAKTETAAEAPKAEAKTETPKATPAPKKSGYIKFGEMSDTQKKAYRAGIASGKDFSVEGIGKYKGSGKTPAKTSVSITKEGPKKEDVDSFVKKTSPQPLAEAHKENNPNSPGVTKIVAGKAEGSVGKAAASVHKAIVSDVPSKFVAAVKATPKYLDGETAKAGSALKKLGGYVKDAAVEVATGGGKKKAANGIKKMKAC